jgi:hypothetical protein
MRIEFAQHRLFHGRIPRRLFLALAVAALGSLVTGAALSQTVAGRVPLTVVILGKGAVVVSKPAGISCPRKCTATYPRGTRVALSPRVKSGFRLLRWAGGCRGSRACTVKVSSPTAVTAEFVTAPKVKATPKSAAESGYFSGSAGGSPLTFFVSPGGTGVLNIQIGQANIGCAPVVTGNWPYDHSFAIPKVAIRRDGSFSGKVTQHGVWGAYAATIAYSVRGRFVAATANSQATAAGSLREDIALQGNPSRCTTNDVSWSATKSGPVPQPKALVSAGSYSGQVGGSQMTFAVSPGGASVVTVVVGQVNIVGCVPALSGAPQFDHDFAIPKTSIRRDGSFAGKAVQSAVLGGIPARIVYSTSGNFQGPNSSGATSAAGSLREDIVLTDSAGAHACTSDTLYWTATRSA